MSIILEAVAISRNSKMVPKTQAYMQTQNVYVGKKELLLGNS